MRCLDDRGSTLRWLNRSLLGRPKHIQRKAYAFRCFGTRRSANGMKRKCTQMYLKWTQILKAMQVKILIL